MTNPPFPISERKLPALFNGHRQLIRSCPIAVKDVLTPYFSIPTASRVHGYFQLQTKQKSPTRRRILERFLSFYFDPISKARERHLHESPKFETLSLITPKVLQVPYLPYPAFATEAPAIPFFISNEAELKDTYTPPCLLKEMPLITPEILCNEQEILARTHSLKGQLEIDRSEMIYLTLESSDNQALIRELIAKGMETTIANFLEHPLGLHIPAFLPEETAKAKKEIQLLRQKGLLYRHPRS